MPKINTSMVVSAAIGVIIVGLIFKHAGDLPIISDAKSGY